MLSFQTVAVILNLSRHSNLSLSSIIDQCWQFFSSISLWCRKNNWSPIANLSLPKFSSSESLRVSHRCRCEFSNLENAIAFESVFITRNLFGCHYSIHSAPYNNFADLVESTFIQVWWNFFCVQQVHSFFGITDLVFHFLMLCCTLVIRLKRSLSWFLLMNMPNSLSTKNLQLILIYSIFLVTYLYFYYYFSRCVNILYSSLRHNCSNFNSITLCLKLILVIF